MATVCIRVDLAKNVLGLHGLDEAHARAPSLANPSTARVQLGWGSRPLDSELHTVTLCDYPRV
jgi:hypothetical protein